MNLISMTLGSTYEFSEVSSNSCRSHQTNWKLGLVELHGRSKGLGKKVSKESNWRKKTPWLGGGFKYIFLIFTPTWGNDPIWLYNIFQMGWNHQLDEVSHLNEITHKTKRVNVYTTCIVYRCFHFKGFQPSLVSMILLGNVVQQCKNVQVWSSCTFFHVLNQNQS